MEDFISSLTLADYITLGIIVFFVIIGACRGFMRSIGGILIFGTASFVSWMFCGGVAEFFKKNTDIFDRISSNLSFGNSIDASTNGKVLLDMTEEEVNTALNSVSLPDVFKKIITDNLDRQYFENETLGQFIDCSLADVIIKVLCFISLFIITAIIASIIVNLLKRIARSNTLRYVDSFLGMLFGVGIGITIVYFLCMLIPTLSIIIKNENFVEFVNSLSTAPIASIFYNDNIISNWLGSVIHI